MLKPWPTPVPPWVPVWGKWRINGRVGPRPAGVPVNVTKAWPWCWVWLKYHPGLKTPTPDERYRGLFASRGAIVRAAGGNVENHDEQAAVGIRWNALNVGDAPLSVWDTQRDNAAKHGITCVPWRQCFSRDDLEALLDVATKWNTPVLVNVEQEILTSLSPAYLAQRLVAFPKEAALIVLGWVQNGQGWKALADRLVILETFTQEQPTWLAATLEAHALAEGLKHVGFAWGTYPVGGKPADPSLYPLDSAEPQCLYTLDDVGPGNLSKWW